MNAIACRNWLFARRNNILTLAWLTPFISLLFTWLSTLTEDDPVSAALGLGRLEVFRQYMVVIVYFFVNAIVSWIVTAYLTTRELEDRHLALLRLTQITPQGLFFGHLASVAKIMAPQIVLFHAGMAIYYLLSVPPGGPTAELSAGLFVGVLVMNLINTFAIATVIVPAVFGKTGLFIALGAVVAFAIVPMDFIFFMIADMHEVPLFVFPAAVLLPIGLMLLLGVYWGKRRWFADWL